MPFDRKLLAASWDSWISNDNRPRAGPWWLQWVWTFAFCAALAVPFAVFGALGSSRGAGAWYDPAWLGMWYGKNLVVCLTIGVLIHLMFDLGRKWFAPPGRVAQWRPWQRAVFFGGVPMLGVVIGWPLGLLLIGVDVLRWLASNRGVNAALSALLLGLFINFLLYHWYAAKARQIEAERRATETQLRLLQAQIEPHFLFNTLANVHSLMDHDLPRAKRMLASFTDYLRASLGTLRAEDSSVGAELELARSYLELLQGRMEDRLRFTIEADDSARTLPLPPLLLQPLVENAVVHGLEPSIDGGAVQVRASVTVDRLRLEVRDDGRGAAARPAGQGAGIALANVRERLAARYGEAATLELLPADPGTLARITIPLSEPCRAA